MKSAIFLPFSFIVFLSLSILQSTSQKAPMDDSIKIQTPGDHATRVTRDAVYYGMDKKGNLDETYGLRIRPPPRPGRQKKKNPSNISNQRDIPETKEEFSQEDLFIDNTGSKTRSGEPIVYEKHFNYPYSSDMDSTFKKDEKAHLSSNDYDYRTFANNYQDNFTKYYEKKPDSDLESNSHPTELKSGREPVPESYPWERILRGYFLKRAPESRGAHGTVARYQTKDIENPRTSSEYEIENIRDYGKFRNSYGQYPTGNVWNFDSENYKNFFNGNTDSPIDFFQQSAIKIVDSPSFNTNFESKPPPGNDFVKPTVAGMRTSAWPTKYSLSEWNKKIASDDFQYMPDFDIKGSPTISQTETKSSFNGYENVNLNKGFYDYSRFPTTMLPAVAPTLTTIRNYAYKNDFFGLEDVSKNNYIFPTLPAPTPTLQYPKADPTIGVSQTIIVPVPQPYPVRVPVARPVAVPIIKEIKVAVEKKVPYPVYKNVLYPVEKRVPVPVEKHVTVPILQPYPVKIPIIKNVYHHSNEDLRTNDGDSDSEIWEQEESSHREWRSRQKRPQTNSHGSVPWKTDRPKRKPHRDSWLKDQPIDYEDEYNTWGYNKDQESWESNQPSVGTKYTREYNRQYENTESPDRERPRKNFNRESWENNRPDENKHRESWDSARFQMWDDNRSFKHNKYHSRKNERHRELSKKYPKQKTPRGRARQRKGVGTRGRG